jgi:predicted transposase YdaD
MKKITLNKEEEVQLKKSLTRHFNHLESFAENTMKALNNARTWNVNFEEEIDAEFYKKEFAEYKAKAKIIQSILNKL